MIVVNENDNIPYDRNSAVTVGTFDGVHLGHIEIISYLNKIKDNKSLRSVVVTFDPHPQVVLKNKAKDIKLLTTTAEKINIFQSLGIDVVYIINFTQSFADTPAEDFIKKYLVEKTGISDLVIGYDHMFGKDRKGSIDTIKKLAAEYGFTADRVDECRINGEIISSTAVRNYLNDGNIPKANELLGREYSIEGTVIEGHKRGRTIGYPTANIRLSDELKQIPKKGIYAVKVELDGLQLNGMMSIGYNPTVSDSRDKFSLEVNIFDFNEDIYNKNIKVRFISYLRDEIKLCSFNDLRKYLDKDKKESLTKE
jgi:riboflavin kinase/FMN adenylyltransferase